MTRKVKYSKEYFNNVVKPHYTELYEIVKEYDRCKTKQERDEIKKRLYEVYDRKNIYYLKSYFKKRGHPSRWQYNPKARYKVIKRVSGEVYTLHAFKDMYVRATELDRNDLCKVVNTLIRKIRRVDKTRGLFSFFNKYKPELPEFMARLETYRAVIYYDTGDKISTGYHSADNICEELFRKHRKYLKIAQDMTEQVFFAKENYDMFIIVDTPIPVADIYVIGVEVIKRTNAIIHKNASLVKYIGIKHYEDVPLAAKLKYIIKRKVISYFIKKVRSIG